MEKVGIVKKVKASWCVMWTKGEGRDYEYVRTNRGLAIFHHQKSAINCLQNMVNSGELAGGTVYKISGGVKQFMFPPDYKKLWMEAVDIAKAYRSMYENQMSKTDKLIKSVQELR